MSSSMNIHEKYSFYKNKGMSGLGNLGNTCYMNSVLQCLSNTLSMTHYLLTYTKDFENSLVKVYTKTLKEMWRENSPLAPKSLKKCVDELLPDFSGTKQQDPHEFLTKFLGIFTDNVKIKNVKFDINENTSYHLKKAYNTWKTHVGDKSLVSELFYGQFSSVSRCSGCHFITKTYDPFMTLDLTIVKDNYSVSDHIKKYFSLDYVYTKCEKCAPDEKDIDVEHEVDKGFFRLPANLIVSLKRFKIVKGKQEKKMDNVFIDERLDLSDYATFSTPDSVVYNLKSIICHVGNSLEGGHYYSVVKTDDDKWVKFNDDRVTPFDFKDLDKTTPYIIFYSRKD